MKKVIVNLKMLQDLDDQINYWQSMVTDGPKNIEELQKKVIFSEKKLNTIITAIDDLEIVKKDLEAEVVSLNDKKEKQKDRQLQVKTNEEFQKLLKEIEHLTEAIANNETLLLENFEQIEKLKLEKPELEKNYNEELALFTEKEKEVKEAMLIGEEKVKESKAMRHQYCENIPMEFMSRYTNLSGNGKRIAMVKVTNGMCTSCMMTVTPQLFNELQINDKILFCSNCNKFVYDPQHVDFNPNGVEENNNSEELSEK